MQSDVINCVCVFFNLFHFFRNTPIVFVLRSACSNVAPYFEFCLYVCLSAFASHSYISICHPFQRDRFCTTRRAVIVISCLGVGSVVLHAVQAYFWQYSPEGADCGLRPDIGHVWQTWSYVTEGAVFLVVPIIIFFLNILVIASAKKVDERQQHRLLSTTSGCSVRRQYKSYQCDIFDGFDIYLVSRPYARCLCGQVVETPDWRSGGTAVRIQVRTGASRIGANDFPLGREIPRFDPDQPIAFRPSACFGSINEYQQRLQIRA